MNLKIILILLVITLPTFLTAQEGKLFVEKEEGIQRMLDTRKELNFRKDRYIKAWSIQLLITRDKYLVTKKKEEFSRQNRSLKADWEYKQPYYRLNVGAFYTKLEATMTMQQLRDAYPDAYVFKNPQAKTTDF